MSEKVKLTREYAHLIESFTEDFSMNFNKMPFETFVEALKNGYEVEEEWKEGDWVTDPKTGRVAQIDQRGYDGEKAWVDDEEFNFFMNPRHSTEQEIAQEKERRFFARHDRDAWELRKGDLLHENRASFTVDITLENSVKFEENQLIFGWDKIKKNFKVACFVEDRLDNAN
ncbi:hypothetical protein [Gracilibacillus thailandensis]|uniref:Uncharacterized protein n=1 Tax=Gracilibacillus thailandensis TaxID=563735 RepID=A0A6N7R2H4_9BACI|nr:hypothetical protein [Gracilibacillus thailandensis]MRI65126.1 hypothetical protein [Gracilibacillus thailandensis]